jgi:hypothetical protein
MAKTWKGYWETQLGQIEKGLSHWRENGSARVRLQGLRDQTVRKDLYTCVTVTVHGAVRGGGQWHRLTLAQVIAPLLRKGESLKLCIRGIGTPDDYLDFISA